LQLARGEHHRLIGAVEPVAVDVDVVEAIIGPDLLYLAVGVHQRLPVPQTNVVDGRAIGVEGLRVEALLDREWLHRDLMKVIGLLRERDVVLQIWRSQQQLVWLHVTALKHRRHEAAHDEWHRNQDRERRRRQTPAAPAQVFEAREGAGRRDQAQQPQYW